MKIPITFEYQGREYRGEFQPVYGAGAGVWHLMIDSFYYGRLRLTEGRWQFDGNKHGMEDLAEYFGDYVTAWLQ